MAEEAAAEKLIIRDPDGVVTEEATRKNGVLDGETVLYSAGRVAARLQFREGKQNGEAVFFDDAGQVQTRVNYLDGKRHGDSFYFRPDGRLARKSAFEAGQLQGYTVDYYPSGKPREVSTYKNNVLDGELIRLTEDGKVTERLHYKAGRQVAGPPPAARKPAPKPAPQRG